MDETIRHHNPNPLLKANFFSRLFFWWLNPFFAKGYRRHLNTDDMYNVVPEDSSHVLCQRLESEWDKEIVKLKGGGKPSLVRALVRTFGRKYMFFGLIVLIEESTKVCQPLLLGGLIRYFTPASTIPQRDAYLYALGLSLCSIVLAIFHHPYFFGVQRIGMQIRVACCSLLYKKSLRLSNKALGQTTTGQIVNLMSNDVNRFDQACLFIHYLWVGPLQAIAVLIILWHELGPACLAGFGVLLLLIPVQGWMGRMFSSLRQKTAKFTDERVRIMNEIITGMRVIKMYCWEKPFGKLVQKVRSMETVYISKTNTGRAFSVTNFFVASKVIVFATLVVYVLDGNGLENDNVFVTITLYNAVRLTMTLFFAFAIQNIGETKVTIQRCQEILCALAVLYRGFTAVGPESLCYWKILRLKSVFAMVSRLALKVMILLTLVMTSMARPFPIEVVFQLMMYFSFLRVSLAVHFALSISCVAEILVTLCRIQETGWHFGFKLLMVSFVVPAAVANRSLTARRVYMAVVSSQILQLSYLGFLTKAVENLAFARVTVRRFEETGWHFGIKLLMVSFVVPLALSNLRLTARRVYMAVVSSQILQFSYLGFLTEAVESLAFARVTVRRLETFLMLEEREVSSSLDKSDVRPAPSDCGVAINDFTAKWDKNVEQNTLEKLSVEVKPGNLLAVIGPVGAGKSSLLMSILGELPAADGGISVRGKISYAAQQPWVFSASLRQNIVFGQKYDPNKYDKIVKLCALKKDLDLMPHGDGTLIGDRGISLSGGQRARVSLARALYMDADVYLLDDPLSAVDAEVGRHIFEKVVMGFLKDKPRILVTHQLQYLTVADEILILKEGQTMGKGTFNELSESGVDFSALLKREEEQEEDIELQKSKSHLELMRSLSHSSRHTNDMGSTMSLDTVNLDYQPDAVQLREEEEVREGTIGLGVYKHYFLAGANICMLIILVMANLMAQTAFVMSDWFLSYWANQEEAKYAATLEHDHLVSQGYNMTNVTIPFVDMPRNVYIFTALTVGVFIFGIVRALLFFRIAITASKTLHNRMFDSILRTKVSFFDTNPVGRILNRFSKDVGHMDDNLPITFFDFVQCFLLILGIVVVAGVVNPWVFIPIIPLTIAFMAIRHYYIKTSRNIKRLEGTTRSPVFSHLSASLQGLGTIRAFDVEDKFVHEFDSHQDLHTEAWFLFISSSRWLAVRLDWLCASFVSAVAFCSVLAADSLDAGLVGLSVTYAMTLMGMFQWAVRQSAEVENQMVSVERVLEYSNLPQEAPLESDPDHKPPPSWPHSGVISGEQVGLRYAADAPLVLKNINFLIQAKEKVGIVGRTGAGKSSLLTVLFRLVEPEGRVLIDGLNIAQLGLHDLRNKISIIPQDPTLFTGSVRVNLDPFEQHADSVLWSALEEEELYESLYEGVLHHVHVRECARYWPRVKGDLYRRHSAFFHQWGAPATLVQQMAQLFYEVQLKSVIEDLPEGLEWGVSEGGINFSVGQRQLICLARAILRKNKILVIDEATANVDPRTDSLIQETIREKFAECTVLTIAHRLHTIMDSDRVMVLDEGRILAFDEPYTLLQDKKGHFYKMVEQTGRAEMENLIAMAQAAQEQKGLQQLSAKGDKYAENGIKPPVILKLNDNEMAPMASPESSTLGRKPKKIANATSPLIDTPEPANESSRNIPETEVVVHDNGSPAQDVDTEENPPSESDKLIATATVTI